MLITPIYNLIFILFLTNVCNNYAPVKKIFVRIHKISCNIFKVPHTSNIIDQPWGKKANMNWILKNKIWNSVVI